MSPEEEAWKATFWALFESFKRVCQQRNETEANYSLLREENATLFEKLCNMREERDKAMAKLAKVAQPEKDGAA